MPWRTCPGSLRERAQGTRDERELLVELAEGNVDVEEALNMKPLRSLALRLAAEPQVVDATMHKVLETDAYRTEIVQG
jgi:hypothetical protein